MRLFRVLDESVLLLGHRTQLDPAELDLSFSATVFAIFRDGDRQAVEAAQIEIPRAVDALR